MLKIDQINFKLKSYKGKTKKAGPIWFWIAYKKKYFRPTWNICSMHIDYNECKNNYSRDKEVHFYFKIIFFIFNDNLWTGTIHDIF